MDAGRLSRAAPQMRQGMAAPLNIRRRVNRSDRLNREEDRPMRGKRIIVLLLAVVLFSAVLPAQAACKHQWSGWEIAQEATDNAMGVRRRVCSKCGKTETKE